MDSTVWLPETRRLMELLPAEGIFLTGIEGSDPFVAGVRRDQFQEAGDFYTTYEERLTRIRDLGISWLRLGPPYSKTHTGPSTYELEWFDKVMAVCQRLGLTVLLDLLHFGLPDWQHEGKAEARYFQNPDFPYHFAAYAKEMVRRYPWVRWFTPVNEPFITASFSSRLGTWNEGKSDGEAYVMAVANVAQAAILAKQSIRQVWEAEGRPDEPLFLQNESFEEAVLGPDSHRQDEVDLFNEVYRFAPLDLILGHYDEFMHDYLMSRRLPEERYRWFMENGDALQTILGIDFYPTCFHEFFDDRIESPDAATSYELYRVVKSYWQRYPLPLLHTEVNAWPHLSLRICQQTYDELSRLRQDGYPIAGMAWYGDESQVDWHSGLARLDYEETPVGLFRQGKPQEVAALFSELARKGLPV